MSVKIQEVSYVSGDNSFQTCGNMYPLNSEKEIFINKEDMNEGDSFKENQKIKGTVSSFWGISFDSYTLDECTVDSDCGEIRECGMTWQCIDGECHQLSIECPLDECTVDSDCYPEGFAPGKCGTFYTCSGGKCYEGSAACPPEPEPIISIEKISEDRFLIKTEAATSITSLNLTVEGQKLYVETSVGNRQINILPEEASSKATEIATVTEIELKEDAQKPVYFVKGTKQSRILFLIPVTLEIEIEVSAETGDIISVNKPWWSFLAW